MKNTRSLCYFLTLSFLFTGILSFAQSPSPEFNPEKERSVRLLFYNAENAFDTVNDPNNNDEEFLPDGVRHWTSYRYYKKIKSIYKVIAAAGGWDPPELVGLCEIENETVLEDIIQNTPLSKYEYRSIHKNSPDQRGIDVALLYNPKKFEPLKEKFIKIDFPGEERPTRDILYAKGICNQKDTLHIFVNHWPSKWGGETETQPKRNLAAKTLRTHVDLVFQKDPDAKIIITGDFNDEPTKESFTEYLKTKEISESSSNNNLYNLFQNWTANNGGTHKYQGRWATLDQFIVSGALLKDENLKTAPENASILRLPALLQEDEKHTGHKPFRTYSGYRYKGGFSDHLPIVLDLD